ncbi:MAG: hypothetical protein ABEI99_05275, partial [Halobaculum sp.]
MFHSVTVGSLLANPGTLRLGSTVLQTVSESGPFPNGITQYAVGGLLVGLGVVLIYLTTGISAGASTF